MIVAAQPSDPHHVHLPDALWLVPSWHPDLQVPGDCLIIINNQHIIVRMLLIACDGRTIIGRFCSSQRKERIFLYLIILIVVMAMVIIVTRLVWQEKSSLFSYFWLLVHFTLSTVGGELFLRHAPNGFQRFHARLYTKDPGQTSIWFGGSVFTECFTA